MPNPNRNPDALSKPHPDLPQSAQAQGFMLVALVVAIFIILLVLGVAAPTVAKQLRREREVEAVHRGNQYVRAVQLYYRKVGSYPGTIDQLEKTNNLRFLRQRYVDPMTGKPDWRLIHVGEAKTTVKGFFGQPLGGIPGSSGGLGSAAGMVSPGTGAAGAAPGSSPSGSSSFGSSSFGSPNGASSGSSFGSSSGSSFGSSTPGTDASGAAPGASGSSFGSSSGGFGSPATGSSGTGSSGTGSPGLGSQSATSFTGTGAPIMGIGSVATGSSILDLNEQTTYHTWEFIYDPRIEQLKAKASLLGGGASSTGLSSFGSSASSPGMGGAATPGSSSPGSPGSGSSSFGDSSFGSGSGSSFGTPGTSGTPPPTTPPQ